MNKKLYLIIISLVTVACIIAGISRQAFRAYRFDKQSQSVQMQDAGEEDVLENGEPADSDDANTDSHSDAQNAEKTPDGSDAIMEKNQADADSAADSGDAADAADSGNASEKNGSADGNKTVSNDPNAFSEAEISLGVFDVTICEGDTYHVDCKVSDEELKPEIRTENGILTIRQKKFEDSDLKAILKLLGKKSIQADLTVTVPKGAKLSSLYLELGTGNLDVKSIATESLSVECGVGDVKFDGVTADKIRVENGMGDTKLAASSFVELSVESGTGDVEVKDLKDLTAYDLNLNTGLGSVYVGENEMDSKYRQSGKEGKKIRIENGTGDIRVV